MMTNVDPPKFGKGGNPQVEVRIASQRSKHWTKGVIVGYEVLLPSGGTVIVPKNELRYTRAKWPK